MQCVIYMQIALVILSFGKKKNLNDSINITRGTNLANHSRRRSWKRCTSLFNCRSMGYCSSSCHCNRATSTRGLLHSQHRCIHKRHWQCLAFFPLKWRNFGSGTSQRTQITGLECNFGRDRRRWLQRRYKCPDKQFGQRRFRCPDMQFGQRRYRCPDKQFGH